MRLSKVFSAGNGIVLLMGSIGCDIPTSIDDAGFGSTSSCLVIGVMHAIDGNVEIVLTDERVELLAPAEFERALDTKARRLCLFTPELEELLRIPVASDRSRVSVYFDDPILRDKVVIAITS